MRLLRWFLALSLVTLGLLLLRPALDKAHVALAYLLLILAASARAGRRVGLVLSVVSFFCFNFFFLEPLHSFTVAEPLDWLVLVALLITSAVAAHLLSVAQTEARTAWERAAEIDRLAVLGAESLNAGPAEQALASIAGVMQDALDVDRCRIFAVDESGGTLSLVAERGMLASVPQGPAMVAAAQSPEATSRDLGMPTRTHLLQWVAEHGRVGIERCDGSMRVGAIPTARSTSPTEPASPTPADCSCRCACTSAWSASCTSNAVRRSISHRRGSDSCARSATMRRLESSGRGWWRRPSIPRRCGKPTK